MRGLTGEDCVSILFAIVLLLGCLSHGHGFEADSSGIIVVIHRKGDDSWESFFRGGRDCVIVDTVNVIQYRDGIVWLKYQQSSYDTLTIVSSGGDDTTRIFYRKIIREVPYPMSEWTVIRRGCLKD